MLLGLQILIVIGGLSTLVWWPAGLIVAALGLVLLGLQYNSGGAETMHFTPSDWRREGDEYVLDVPEKIYGRGSTSVRVWMTTPSGAQEVLCDNRKGQSGEIQVAITSPPFSGHLDIS